MANTRMYAELQAEKANKLAPKGVSYSAKFKNDEWVVDIHDGRRKK